MLYMPLHQPTLHEQLLHHPPLRILSQHTGLHYLAADRLMYLSGEYNYSWLHGQDGGRILVPYTLKRMLARLPRVSFVRLYRSYVVNRHYVDRIETHPTSNHRAYLLTGECLPIARRNWVAIRQQLGVVAQKT